jgi:hypothetical protein
VQEVLLTEIVRIVVQEVMRELIQRGVRVVSKETESKVGSGFVKQGSNDFDAFRGKVEHINMDLYKTPILTENRINRLHELTGEVVVPPGTVITPKAKDALRAKRISLKIA